MPDEESLSVASTARQSPDHSTRPPIEFHARGYHKLAQILGTMPEYGVYRKFGKLNALNLLYLQAELTELELQLQREAAEDDTSADQERRQFYRNWNGLSAEDANGDVCEQWKTVLRIRTVLRMYNEQILAQAQIARLPAPSNADVSWLREWMKGTKMGCVYLLGNDRNIWSDTPLEELIAIKAREHGDAVTIWLTTEGLRFYHKWLGRFIHKPEHLPDLANNFVYSHRGTQKAVMALFAALSSFFPIMSIFILEKCDNFSTRFTVLTVFTVAFSVILTLSAGRDRWLEIFAASAAFAAVQVVFISPPPSSAINQEKA